MNFGRVSGYHPNSGFFRITTDFTEEVSYNNLFVIYYESKLFFDCPKYHKKKIFLAKSLLSLDDPFSLVGSNVLCDDLDLKSNDNNNLLVGYRVIDFNNNDIGCVVITQDFGAGSFLEIYIKNKGICLIPFDENNVILVDDKSLCIMLADIDFDTMHFNAKL